VLVGIAQRDYNNAGNASASSDYVVVNRGFWVFPTVTGAAAANVDGPVYATDDNTLTMAGPGDVATYVAGNPNYAATGAAANGLGRAGANTGNGTIGTITPATNAVPGTYLVLFTGATSFKVQQPNGDYLATTGASGTAFVDGGLFFTLTAGGTANVANDSYTITVADNITLLIGTLSGFDKGTPCVRIKGS
jgi:hypothetical protein